MVTFSEPSASETFRVFRESLMASRISALARRRKRWRLPRLLDFGLRRRSTTCMGCCPLLPFNFPAALANFSIITLARFLHPHVPFDQATHLTGCVAALDHALHELFVLLLGL